jgi:PPK2 family polyphosphate:nucleotide phosphotransferase
MKKQTLNYLKSLHVKPGRKINLEKDFQTENKKKIISKKEGEKMLADGIVELARLQDKLYAYNQYSILIVLQAMDAAGKDGAIKHVMSGFNPQGVKVISFKVPSSTELDHDYFWRHYKELPGRGEIGIFNRSHYENVLVTRVHPEYILNENIPGIDSVKDIDHKFWEARYKQINRFEQNLHENGTIVLKFFLHLSKAEQKKRFIERIDNPEKNWKFSVADYEERKHWKKYMNAYEEMLSATSTPNAPWFVVPADDKWFTRLIIGGIITDQFQRLNMSYPKVSKEQKAQLQELRKELMSEK